MAVTTHKYCILNKKFDANLIKCRHYAIYTYSIMKYETNFVIANQQFINLYPIRNYNCQNFQAFFHYFMKPKQQNQSSTVIKTPFI
jgi:hypothetical protein